MQQNSISGRRGSTYVIVVGSTMLIAIFMMASLMIVKNQRTRFQNHTEIQQARLNAESALDLCLHYIRENPNTWRGSTFVLQDEYGNNPDLQLQMADPVDGDIGDSYEDPVVLQATGTSGDAVQNIRLRLNLDALGYDCLQSAIHSGTNINLSSSSVINTDGTTSYDSTMTVQSNSTVNSEVLGMSTPSIDPSSAINGDITTPGDLPKDTPTRDGVDVFQLYSSGAVEISLSDLYESNHSLNRLQNASFGAGLTGWTGSNCQVSDIAGGVAVSKRMSNDAGVSQDVQSLMYNGGTFRLQCNFENLSFVPTWARIRLKLESSVDGVVHFSTGYRYCEQGNLIPLSGDVNPTWNGQLISAVWTVTTFSGLSGDYQMFAPSMTETTYPDGAFAMRNSLLSPDNNPFGSGTTHASGLYKLDADDQQVFIENSKLSATLLLENSANVTLRESLNMQNAVYNYPTLLADSGLTIGLGDADLDEATADVNFNPLTMPYYATYDADKDDTYETRIDGLVYVNGSLQLTSNLKSHGVWLVDHNLVVNDSQLDITYNDLYYEEPPPGFVDVQDMKVLPGSIQQVVGN